MDKGTILYIGGFELPDKDAAAHRVLNNAKALQILGYKVVFLDVNRETNNNSKLVNKEIQGFECWSRKYPDSLLEWAKYLVDIKDIEKIIYKYTDIKAVICYNYPAVALLKLKKYCSSNEIKLISDSTEWYEDRRIIKKIDTVMRMNFIHKNIDGIICISSYLENYYKRYVNTVVIPPLVDVEEEKWKFKQTTSNTNTVKFVYSGRPGKHKDKLNFVIEAFNKMSKDLNYSFNIIGITKQQYLDYYPEHSTTIANLKNSINFMGKVSHDTSITFVQEADFVLFIREDKRVNNAGFPTKFVESITCGTPVITTNTSDLSNYLIPGKNGFFIDLNKNDNIDSILCKAIKMDIDEIKAMKKYCFQSKTFHYENYISQIDEFLKSVLD